ncbi:MAG: cob(I)yrinic acid a,c-diamide adenosyltransferase [Eubacteriales bacterium]
MTETRMPRLYTRTGDRGETSLLGGKRVSKDILRVSAYGTVDEAGAALALGRSLSAFPWVQGVALRLLKELLLVGAELARQDLPGKGPEVKAEMTAAIEADIDYGLSLLPPLRGFVISGQTPAEAAFDMARTAARRAERMVVRLAGREKVREELVKYLNRLSDLLYVLARVEANEWLVGAVIKRIMEIMQGGKGMSKAINLETAREIAAAAEQKAKQVGVPMVIVIADEAGNPVLLHRMDGSLLASLDIAAGKAYSAVSLKMETAALAPLAAPGGSLYGINTSNGGRIVPFGGGIPLRKDGLIAGSIGVSGGSVEEDLEVARAGVGKWEEIGLR